MKKLAEVLAKTLPTISKTNQALIPTPAEPNLYQCADCLDTGFFRADVPLGDRRFGKLTPCDGAAHTQDRQRKMARVSGLRAEDLAKTLLDITVTDKNRAMIDAAKNMINEPYGFLYFHGGPGNAKSEALIAIVNELGQANYGTVMYTKFSTIIDYMRDSFREKQRRHLGSSDDSTYIDRFERLKQIKVLAIDEMDKVTSTTSFVQDFRFDFLDDRYRQALEGKTVTLFASNADPAGFPSEIYDRLRDGRFNIIENKAGSARPFMKRTSVTGAV